MSESIAVTLADQTAVTIEYEFVGATDVNAPWLVILHEGLGSVAMWKNFPQQLCAACNVRGLVYSRPGYGCSTPRAPDERWAPDFMHIQARDVLPALLTALNAPPRYHLFGHSDGASISLIHAASFPERVASTIVLAPHILVEQLSVDSIAEARGTYLNPETKLRSRLARYHANVDSAFWGWNDIWLAPAFRDWNILEMLPDIRCPVLAIQGVDDQYGTMAQIDGIAAALPAERRELIKLDACGHSPHRDQAEAVVTASCKFLGIHAKAATLDA